MPPEGNGCLMPSSKALTLQFTVIRSIKVTIYCLAAFYRKNATFNTYKSIRCEYLQKLFSCQWIICVREVENVQHRTSTSVISIFNEASELLTRLFHDISHSILNFWTWTILIGYFSLLISKNGFVSVFQMKLFGCVIRLWFMIFVHAFESACFFATTFRWEWYSLIFINSMFYVSKSMF